MYDYSNLVRINEGDEMDIEPLECYPVATNEDGWTLMEFDLTFYDSPVCIETVCELFPYYGIDVGKGYMLVKDGVFYYE